LRKTRPTQINLSYLYEDTALKYFGIEHDTKIQMQSQRT